MPNRQVGVVIYNFLSGKKITIFNKLPWGLDCNMKALEAFQMSKSFSVYLLLTVFSFESLVGHFWCVNMSFASILIRLSYYLFEEACHYTSPKLPLPFSHSYGLLYEFCSLPNSFCSLPTEMTKMFLCELTHSSVNFKKAQHKLTHVS